MLDRVQNVFIQGTAALEDWSLAGPAGSGCSSSALAVLSRKSYGLLSVHAAG